MPRQTLTEAITTGWVLTQSLAALTLSLAHSWPPAAKVEQSWEGGGGGVCGEGGGRIKVGRKGQQKGKCKSVLEASSETSTQPMLCSAILGMDLP